MLAKFTMQMPEAWTQTSQRPAESRSYTVLESYSSSADGSGLAYGYHIATRLTCQSVPLCLYTNRIKPRAGYKWIYRILVLGCVNTDRVDLPIGVVERARVIVNVCGNRSSEYQMTARGKSRHSLSTQFPGQPDDE